MEKEKYSVIFYKDRRGRQPIAEYLAELVNTKSKDARIKFNKIEDYIRVLKIRGISAREPFIKHLKDEIWELRPLKDRILFAAFDGKSFILLHYFRKETQKTPIREILQAKRNYSDFKRRNQNEKEKN